MKLGPTVQRVWDSLPFVICEKTCSDLGLSPQRLSNIISYLGNLGLIDEAKTRSPPYGRPTRVISKAEQKPTTVQMIVIQSIRNGNTTSRKVSKDVGLHINHVSQVMRQLEDRGFVKRAGKIWTINK